MLLIGSIFYSVLKFMFFNSLLNYGIFYGTYNIGKAFFVTKIADFFFLKILLAIKLFFSNLLILQTIFILRLKLLALFKYNWNIIVLVYMEFLVFHSIFHTLIYLWLTWPKWKVPCQSSVTDEVFNVLNA